LIYSQKSSSSGNLFFNSGFELISFNILSLFPIKDNASTGSSFIRIETFASSAS